MAQNSSHTRKKMIAVIGDNCLDPAALEPHQVAGWAMHRQCWSSSAARRPAGNHGSSIQRCAAAAFRGVRQQPQKVPDHASTHREGDTIIPGDDRSTASEYADIVICTGLGSYRNAIVGRADAVVAVGGGAGTLQELCTAWKAQRPIVVLVGVSGFAAGLAGRQIDSRGDADRAPVLGAHTAEEAVHLVWRHLRPE